MRTKENASSEVCVQGSEYTKLSTAASWSWIKGHEEAGVDQLQWALRARLFTTGVKPGKNEANATGRQMYQLIVITYQLCTFPMLGT